VHVLSESILRGFQTAFRVQHIYQAHRPAVLCILGASLLGFNKNELVALFLQLATPLGISAFSTSIAMTATAGLSATAYRIAHRVCLTFFSGYSSWEPWGFL
jgi:hypothetical protein